MNTNLNVWQLAHRGSIRHLRFDFSPDAPDRNVGQESRDTYAAAAEFAPQFGRLQRQETEKFISGSPEDGTRGLLDIYEQDIAPRFAASDRAAGTAQREADIADVTRLGAGAVDAFRSANPQQKALVDALNAEALAGVQAGRNLPPALQRRVEQNVRSGQAARGFGFGMDNALQEALATTDAAENYFQNNFARATGVAGLNQATSGDAFQMLTGRASGAGGMGVLGLGNSNAQGTIGQVSNMAGNIFDWNANQNANEEFATANNYSGMASGALSSL